MVVLTLTAEETGGPATHTAGGTTDWDKLLWMTLQKPNEPCMSSSSAVLLLRTCLTRMVSIHQRHAPDSHSQLLPTAKTERQP